MMGGSTVMTVAMIVVMVGMMGGMMAGAVWVWVRRIAKRGSKADQDGTAETETHESQAAREGLDTTGL
jgi:hypothetical protein